MEENLQGRSDTDTQAAGEAGGSGAGRVRLAGARRLRLGSDAGRAHLPPSQSHFPFPEGTRRLFLNKIIF